MRRADEFGVGVDLGNDPEGVGVDDHAPVDPGEESPNELCRPVCVAESRPDHDDVLGRREVEEPVEVYRRERLARDAVDDEVRGEPLNLVCDARRTRDPHQVGTGPQGGPSRQRRRPGVRAAPDDEHLAVLTLVRVGVAAESEEVARTGEPLGSRRNTDVCDGHRGVEPVEPRLRVVKRHHAVGGDRGAFGPAGPLAGVGVDARRDVDGDHRRAGRAGGSQFTHPFRGGPFRLAQRARDPRAEHRVDDDVRRAEVEVGGVGDGDRRNLGRAERLPVLAGDLRPDRFRPPQQVDGDRSVREKPRCDEPVAAVVPPATDERDLVAGVGDRPDRSGDGVARRFHQLFARDAEGGRVGVDRRHPAARYHVRRSAGNAHKTAGAPRRAERSRAGQTDRGRRAACASAPQVRQRFMSASVLPNA